MLKPYLKKIVAGSDLEVSEAEAAMEIIMGGQAAEAEIGGYLVGLRMKGETVPEITGSARAMRRVVKPVPTSTEKDLLVDTAGTGGDGSQSFNISTAAAFIIAGAGRPVAKHGNRAASSRCGSADVLESLGVNLDLSPEQVGRCIDEVGIGFMFAPKFHPAMKHAIGPRKALGLRTIFNLLGPLTNPAGASQQLIGVFDPQLTEPLAHVLGQLGGKSAMVVHGHGGLDELSTSGPNQVSQLSQGQVRTYQFDPSSLNLQPARSEDLEGGDAQQNAARMRHLLAGSDSSTLKEVVLLNAAAGLALDSGSIAKGMEAARQSLESGAALEKLEILIDTSQAFS